MYPTSRRTVSVLVRLGLVGLTIVLVAGWMHRHFRSPAYVRHARVETMTPAAGAVLGPGDYRLYNVDSSVDVTLLGDRLLAGLSPKTIAEIRGRLDSSRAKDTSGVGGAIASMVKQTIADRIGTHAAFRVADIRDIQFADGRLVVNWRNDSHPDVFGEHVKVNGNDGNRFRQDEAERFIAAFHARQSQLGK